MKLNAKKCASISLRGSIEGSLNGKTLVSAKKRDLGDLMNNNSTWSLKRNTRLNKAWRAFYFLKRNISKIPSWKTKLNAYSGYVVPVIAYASEIWYASKGDMKTRKATEKSNIVDLELPIK